MESVPRRCPPEIFLEEKNNLARCRNWITGKKSKNMALIRRGERAIDAEQYEDQDAFIVYGEATSWDRKLQRDIDLLNKLEQNPYICRIETHSGGESKSFYLSDNESLDEVVDLSPSQFLLPFKLNDERPLINSLMQRYYSVSAEPFTVNGYDYAITVMRQTQIEKGLLQYVRVLFPELPDEDAKIIADELLIKRLNENRHDARLRNIIATIRAHQFDVINLPADKSFVLQGCAGSGKTQVLLHRLFYLRSALGQCGWEDVVILTPTKLFRHYSADLLRRFQLWSVPQVSLAEFYQELLNKYDPRFKSRQYEFVLTEEYLPDEYLHEIYAPENIANVKEALKQAIRERILEGCRLTGMVFPESGQYDKVIGKLIESLDKLITNIDSVQQRLKEGGEYQSHQDALDTAAKSLTANEKKSSRLREELQTHQIRQAKFENLFSAWIQAREEEKDLRKRHEEEKRQAQIRLNTSEHAFSDALDDRARFDAMMEYAKAAARAASIQNKNGKYQREYADYIWLHTEICKECEEKLRDVCGRTVPERWRALNLREITNVEEQLHILDAEAVNAARGIAEHTGWMQEHATALGLSAPAEEDMRKKSEMERARYFLSRLESSVFEQEVWKVLSPTKEKRGVRAIREETLESGGVQQTRVLYKSDLLFYLMIYYEIYGRKGLPAYKLFCIDEGQDLHAADYGMLRSLYPSATMNIFGDLTQSLHENCGITDWAQETGIEAITEMNDNYRSAPEIVDFCNKHFGTNMRGFGSATVKVTVIQEDNREVLGSLFKVDEELSVIVKDRYAYDRLIAKSHLDPGRFAFLDTNAETAQQGKINVYTVFAAKGLEFTSVLVMEERMNLHQKIVACTRATERLIYCEYEQEAPV